MTDRSVRQALRLARLYPRRWRQQFPDFVWILADELAERRRGVRGDVVRAALGERLRASGILPAGSADGARSGLALIYAALVPFAGLAMGMWSQLHTGLASPGATSTATLRASDLLLIVGTLVMLVALPLAVLLLAVEVRRTGPAAGRALYRSITRPVLALVGSLVVLTAVGWGADRSHWYSPAAIALPRRGLGHLLTLWIRGIIAPITPAWVHPGLFAGMPTGELAAASLAPVAALVLVGAVFRVIVRFPIGTPGRATVVLAVGAFGMMCLSVAASGRWLLDHPGQRGTSSLLARNDQLAPGHTGWAVVLLLAVLTVVALAGLRRVLRAQPDGPTGGAMAVGGGISPVAAAGSGTTDDGFVLSLPAR